MSSDEVSIHVANLSKRFEMYAQPVDRLKQMVLPKAQRLLHRRERAYFREFWALHGIDFDVHKGETVGIVGRNGSGKSTLLQLICGTLTPTQGTIGVNGRIAALLELGSGFNPEFTGRENVYLNAAVLGLSRDEIDARYAAIIEFADIGDFVEQPVKTYSSGMYVRLAFAVAINVSPDILVVDEALSVGDEAFQRKCFARIGELRDGGATILFVSHAAGTVIDLCDRAVLLDRGELIARGSPKFVVSRYHKLMYADASKAPALRELIKRESLLFDHDKAPAGAGSARDDSATGGEPVKAGVDDAESYFDPGMVPRSTVRYESRGAMIDPPRIETLDGRKVNVLRSGGEYIYTYDVAFQRTVVGVRLGMMIKTITGMELGGAATAANMASGAMFLAGQSVRARFRFRALLAPGVYFMNAGATAAAPDGETYLDRIIDALMFRIAGSVDRVATGTVDFQITPLIKEAVAS